MSTFSTENETKLLEIENFLANNSYLSGGAHPNQDDSVVFLSLKNAPSVNKYPNFFYWYSTLCNFNPEVIKSWQKKASAPAKPAEKKAEAEAKKDDDFDLFGGDAAPTENKEKKPEPKKEKKKAIAKSIIVFDVKVFEQEQDLDELAKRILAEQVDGLVWRQEYSKKPVAYGMNKLEIGCIIEDDKVGTDDLFERFQSKWEDEIQSIDIVTFQKL